MYGFMNENLRIAFEEIYISGFIVDSIISKTEDFFTDVENDYNPRSGDIRNFMFKYSEHEYCWSLMRGDNHFCVKIQRNDLSFEIQFSYDIYINPEKDKFKNIPDKNKYWNSEKTKERVSEKEFQFFSEYAKELDSIVEDKKEIQNLFTVRTNPGLPIQSTYVVDDFIHKFAMELSWMKSEKYIVERLPFNKFLRMDLDDLNYNHTVYRLKDRDLNTLNKLRDFLIRDLHLGKRYRIDNICLNGLFYIENCDIQDISECGYDTIENLCSAGDKAYKVCELYIEEENDEN
jgi:hypothetical protein